MLILKKPGHGAEERSLVESVHAQDSLHRQPRAVQRQAPVRVLGHHGNVDVQLWRRARILLKLALHALGAKLVCRLKGKEKNQLDR